MGILSYPIYVIFNSFFYSLFSLILGGNGKLLIYGFTCVTEENSINIIFYTFLFLTKLALLVLLYLSLYKKHLFTLVLFPLVILDMISILFYVIDIVFGTYLKFIFFSSTPLYIVSNLYGLGNILVPILFFIFGFFVVSKMLKTISYRNIFLKFLLIISNIFIFYLVLSNLFR